MILSALKVRSPVVSERVVGESRHSENTFRTVQLLLFLVGFWAIIGPLFLFPAPSSARAADLQLTPKERAWLVAHPEITIAHTFDWPPYSFLDSNKQPVGPSVEIFELVAQMAGFKFKVHTDGLWNRIYEAGKNKQVDVVASMTITKDREQWFSFPRPYLSLSSYIVTRKDYQKIKSRDDLKGKKISGAKGTWQVSSVLKNYPSVSMEYVDTYTDALMSVSAGKADATVMTLGSILYDISQKGIYNLRLAAPYEKDTDLITFGVRKDWPELVSIVDKALAAIPEAKKVEIISKWMPPLDSQTPGAGPTEITLTEDEQAWLAQNHTVRVSAVNQPPYMIVQKNAPPEGISIAYLEEISERTGIDFEYETADLPFEEFLESMKEGRGPDLTTVLVRTPEREEFLSFADSYLETPVVIFARSEAGFITGINDLSGKSVAVSRGGHVHTQMGEGYPEIKLALFESAELALTALATGQVNAYIGNLTVSSHIIHKYGFVDVHVVAPTPFDAHVLSMASRKDWPELISIINKALNSMSSEKHTAFKAGHLRLPIGRGISSAEIRKWALIIFLPVLLIILVVVLWNRQMAKEVTRRTAELEGEIAERRNTVKALRASDERYRAFVENSSEAIWCYELKKPLAIDLQVDEQIDLLYKYASMVEANDAQARMLGYERGEELAGFRLEDSLPRSMPESIASLKRFVLEQYNLVDLETLETTKDGKQRFFTSNIVGIIEDGHLLRIWGSTRDITERKLADEEIAGLAMFPSENPRPVLRILNDGTVVSSNKAGEPLLESWGCKVGQKLTNGELEILNDASNAGKMKAVEYQCNDVMFLLNFVPVADRDYVNIYAEDITARKQSEEELTKSELKYRSLVDNSLVGVFSTSLDGRFLFVNDAMVRISEFENAAQLMAHGSRALWADKRQREKMIALLEKHGSVSDFEAEIFTSTGGHINVLFSAKMVGGDISGMVMDITQLKKAEEDVRSQREAVARLNRTASLQQLSVSIAHELNQPLTGILGSAQACDLLIQQGRAESTEVREILADIAEAAKHAGDVTRNLRDFYRTHAVEFKTVDMGKLVSRTLRMLKSEFIMRRVRVDAQLAKAGLDVHGNAVQLQQVLLNVIQNAYEAMDGIEGARIRILSATDPGAKEVTVVIEDSGPGIAPDATDDIFEPLFTSKSDGTGMGLAISTSIIKAHGGRLWAENRPEGGARVAFAIPALRGRSEA